MPIDHKMNDMILIAIPDDWRTEVVKHLMHNHLSVVEAVSYDDALSAVKNQNISAVITVIDWIVSADKTFTTLWDSIQQDIPVLILVEPGNNYEWMDIAFKPPLHDYRHIPFGLGEIDDFLTRNGFNSSYISAT